jgi:glycosyltransferase involved in cell wall biosynthesis
LQYIHHLEKIDLPRGQSYLARLRLQLAWIIKASKVLKNLGVKAGVTIGPPCSALSVDIAMAGSCHLAALLQLRKEGKYRWLLNPMNWISIGCEYLLFRNPNTTVIIPSTRTSKEIHQLYKTPLDRLMLIPHGVDLSLFSPAPTSANKSHLRQELNLPLDCLILLTVANELERKGCYEVLKALKLLQEKNIHPCYIIAGRADYDDFAKTVNLMGLTDSVSLLPPKNNQQLVKLYQAADIFLLPTKYESFGLVGIEAMACGLSVIACAVGGIEDYLINQREGLIIPRTPIEIAQAVYELSGDELRLAMSKNAITKSQQYDWNKVLPPLQELVDRYQAKISPIN